MNWWMAVYDGAVRGSRRRCRLGREAVLEGVKFREGENGRVVLLVQQRAELVVVVRSRPHLQVL